MWNTTPVNETLLNPWFPVASPSQTTWLPRLNVWDDEAELLFELEMAGVDPESIEIELDETNNSFIVQGKRNGGRVAIYREIPGGNLQRMVPLPWPAAELEASYAEGILQVRVSKPDAKGNQAPHTRKVRPKKATTVKV